MSSSSALGSTGVTLQFALDGHRCCGARRPGGDQRARGYLPTNLPNNLLPKVNWRTPAFMLALTCQCSPARYDAARRLAGSPR
jgi:hypothetical protein